MMTLAPSRGVGSGRRADIDGLRGIAVVAVVVFHFAPDVLPGGLLGVDVFFVISGYVITNLLLSQQTSSFTDLRRFWGNRIRRLFPALIVVLAAVMTAGYFWLWSPQYVELAESGAWASFMASNIFFFQQTGYFAPAADTVPLLNLWSLGVEEQFYLAWPLLMAAIMRFSKKLKFTVVVSLGLGSWLAALVVVGLADDQGTALASVFYLPHFRAWELCAGASLAIAGSSSTRTNHKIAKGHRPAALSVAALTVLGLSFVVSPSSENPSLYALASVVATATLIRVGSTAPSSTRLVGNRILLWLGQTSYPLYLWHYPILAFSIALGFGNDLVHQFALVSLSLILGDLTWRLVERPIRRRPVTPTLVATLGACMLVLMVLSVEVIEADGFPNRGGSFERELATFTYTAQDAFAHNQGGSCWISDQLNSEQIDSVSDCLVAVDSKWNVLLWGDSYAATLYTGLMNNLSSDQTLSQLTADSCFTEYGREVSTGPACTQITQIAGEAIRSGTFDEIIISTHWRDSASGPMPRIIEGILRDSDIEVLLIGPFPEWAPHLPHIIFAKKQLPEYLSDGSIQRTTLNSEFRTITDRFEVKYFDMLELLCNGEGCRARTGTSAADLTTWDHGHLTKSASDFVGQRLARRLGPES